MRWDTKHNESKKPLHCEQLIIGIPNDCINAAWNS